MQANPYDILGVSEHDSIDNIERAYKNLMKLLHPDKAQTSEAKKLNMSPEEKNQYLRLIQGAYKKIESFKRVTNYPDYKVDYKVDEEVRIYTDREFESIRNGGPGAPGAAGAAGGSSFNKDKFNMAFTRNAERDRQAGISDAYSRGYGEFDVGKKFSDTGNVTAPAYSGDIDTSASNIFKKPAKDDRIVEYLPESAHSFGAGYNYQELGLTTVSDFSLVVSGKSCLEGTDLMSVYGNNYEPWEESVKRDPKLSARFTNEGSITDRMKQMESGRGSIYDLPTDRSILEAEMARNFAQEQQEKIRIANVSNRDEYFNELNRGLLLNGQGGGGVSVPLRQLPRLN